jgi:formate--tetrahydrofolate ligase
MQPSPRPIAEVAAELGLSGEHLEPYGRLKAKIRVPALPQPLPRRGKLVLMTGMSPTPAGEGKTTLTIGLCQGLRRLGARAAAALRQPSQGPVFGTKGGGAGGGRAQLVPMEDINLHFTGDLHAIAAANNLLAALIDNHLYWGQEPALDPASITWKRCLDVNDRSLRRVVTGVGEKDREPRDTAFEITAASVVMALLSLAESWEDLEARLARIVVGLDRGGAPVTAGELGAAGSMAVLLREAMLPNLVQTVEGAPALVHGGPFGNIAHGCSSVISTRTALALADVCVTEAGFGADLGAEKFMDIKARQSGLWPDLAVLLVTVRALKMHGGVSLEALDAEDLSAVRAGFVNVERHLENLAKFGLPVVAAVNRFASDTPAELEAVVALCVVHGVPAAVADPWACGGEGSEGLGSLVLESLNQPADPRPLYGDDLPLREKIETLAREIYRAGKVEYGPDARAAVGRLEAWSAGGLPVCMAKTQYSFSGDPKLLGAPEGHTLTIRDLKLSAGAGFVVAYAGDTQTMPGLPRHPAAEHISLTPEGVITGLT